LLCLWSDIGRTVTLPAVVGDDKRSVKDLGAEIARVIGPRIAVRREAIGLSQEDLADRAGLHRTAISPLELGKRGTRVETLFRIAGVLGVRPFELLDGFYWVPDGEGGACFTTHPPGGNDQ
jgi:DNA-binding XRE family transcriptional regulator